MGATETAISITDFIGSTAALSLRVGSTALPIAQFIAGFVPGLAPAANILALVTPYLQKMAAAAPVVRRALEEGRPIVEAIEKSGPAVMSSLKEVYAITVSEDPKRPEKNVKAEEVEDKVVVSFLGNMFERSFFSPQDPRFDRVTNLG